MFIFLGLLFLSAGAVQARTESFAINDGKKITLEIAEGWEGVKDLYGLPLVVLGPWANESRPAMSFVYTGMKEKNFPQTELQKLFVDFKSQKQKWIDGHKGELLSYEPMTPVKYGKNSGHYIGAQFKLNGIQFIERSYYITCEGEVYNLKYSIRMEHEKYLKDLTKIVELFQCK